MVGGSTHSAKRCPRPNPSRNTGSSRACGAPAIEYVIGGKRASADLRFDEPPQRAERRLEFVDPRVGQDYVTRSYLAPERDHDAQEKAAALVYLSEILGGSSATSVLGRALTFDSNTAVYAGAGYYGMSLDDTTFTLSVAPSDGVSLEQAERAMDATLEQFLQDGIDPAQFDRIRTQLRASEIYALDNVEGLANRYGAALAQGLTVEDVEAWPDILQAVTPEDVMAAAREVLNRNNAVTAYVMAAREPEPEPMTDGGN